MPSSVAGRSAWSLAAVALSMMVAGVALSAVADGAVSGVDIGLTAVLLTFPVVGALVASRQPDNAIGWLFCAAGTLFGAASLAQGYAEVALPDGRPGAVWAAWLSGWLYLAPVFGLPSLLFLLFPDGRPLRPRWRAAVWVAAAAVVLQSVGTAMRPGELLDAPVQGIENPLGVAGAELPEGLGWALGLHSLLLATTSLTLRFRRARGVERVQMTWFVSAAVVFAVSIMGEAAIWAVEGDVPEVVQLLVLAAYATIPLASGIAILRHRLYDIDVVIKRTLVYGSLTALLLATYLGLVLVLRLVLSPVTGESDLAVAGSTLAVAALFRPLRARVQAVVDRRFYRRRYDAARTLDDFSTRLRDELDLETLGNDLRRAVRETLAPTSVSLWLREATS